MDGMQVTRRVKGQNAVEPPYIKEKLGLAVRKELDRSA